MPDVALRDRLAMVSELATASGVAGMCGGQSLDLEAEGKRVDLQALEQIHRHKTGALIRAAVRRRAERRRSRTCGVAAAGSLRRRGWPGVPYRMTFWTLSARLKNRQAPERTNNTERVPTRRCSGLTARKQKRGISIRKH